MNQRRPRIRQLSEVVCARGDRRSELVGLLLVTLFALWGAGCPNGSSDDPKPCTTNADCGENSKCVGGACYPDDPPQPQACPSAPSALLEDREVHQAPALAEPARGVRFLDPVFGTCMVRVTDRKADVAPGDASTGLKNEYSRVQAFNADETRILVRGTEGTWYLYNAQTLAPLGQQDLPGTDPRWDASDPDLLYYVVDTTLVQYRVSTRQSTLVHDFAADFPGQTLTAVWTRYEGSPSRDGNTWGMMAQDANWNAVALLVYDLPSNTIVSRRVLTNAPSVDTVGISPSGNYLLAHYDYCPSGLGTLAAPCGVMVYDRNLSSARGLVRMSSHGDLAHDINGREVWVFQDNDTDQISVADLATGVITPLWPIDFSHTAISFHFTGRGFGRPGWALLSSTDGDAASHTWMDDGLFAIELVANGRVVRIAHDRTVVDTNQEHDYWAEPHATVNRDFTRVLFTTNWGRSGTAGVDMYMVELPPQWWQP